MPEPASRWRVVEKVLFAFGCMAIAFFCGMIVARTRVFPYPEINAAQAAAQQVIARLPSGYYYRPLDGGWTRK